MSGIIVFVKVLITLTEGSRSIKMDRGTYFPLRVSVKKVSKDPASPTFSVSGSGRPSGFRPCSSRYLGSEPHVRTVFKVAVKE